MATSRPTFLNLPIPKRSSWSPKSMVTTTMSTHMNNNWVSISDQIDAHLKQSIPLRPPLEVFEPMHRLTFSAPRTTAPALCVASCELVGGDRDQAVVAASTFRVLLASAFIHDQLLMTGSSRPGSNMELLTGDGLVSFGLELLASLDDPARNNSDRVLRVIREVTRAIKQFTYGRSNEPQSSRFEGDGAMKKGGEIHACAGACGAIIGGGSEEEIEKLRRYGFYVGMVQGVEEDVNDLRKLALKELESFNQENVQEISKFLEINMQ